MYYVQTKEKRNVQTRLFHGNVLKSIDLAGGGDIEEGAHFALVDHIVIIGAASPRPCRLACRVLNQLADFFLKGHFPEEVVDCLFVAGIGKACTGCRGPGSLL